MSTPGVHPFFTVVIPHYNRFDLFKESVSSVENQSFRDFDIVVVDDGSTDGSYEKLLSGYNGKERFSILHQKNKERGAARNLGFNNATGMYVVYFDSDDLMHTNHLDTLHKIILEQNYPDIVADCYNFIRNGKYLPSDSMKLKPGWHDYRTFLKGNPLACNFAVKREYKKLIPFEEDRRLAIKEDWIFLLRNLKNTRLFLDGRVTLTMKDHDERSMRKDHGLIIEKSMLAMSWIKKYVSLNHKEQNQLDGHLYHLSAIHSYIDGDRESTFRYLTKSVMSDGIKKKHFILGFKAVIGHRILSIFK